MLILNSTLDEHLKYYFWKKDIDTNEYPYKILEEHDWGWKVLYNQNYDNLLVKYQSGLLFVHKCGFIMEEFDVEENDLNVDTARHFITYYSSDDTIVKFLCLAENYMDPQRQISFYVQRGREYDI